MIEAVDSYVLGQFEALSHRTQRWVSWASLDWERTMLVVAIATLLSGGPKQTGDVVQFFVALICSACFIETFTDHRPRRRQGENLAANPLKLTLRGWRVFGLAVMLLRLPLVLAGFDSPWYEASLCAFYFQSCDDLPPGKSRLRQMLQRLRKTFAPVAQPVGA